MSPVTRHPYKGATQNLIVGHLIFHEPTPLETYAPDLPPDVIALVHGALQRDPAHRFPTMDAFTQAARACSVMQGAPSLVATPHASVTPTPHPPTAWPPLETRAPVITPPTPVPWEPPTVPTFAPPPPLATPTGAPKVTTVPPAKRARRAGRWVFAALVLLGTMTAGLSHEIRNPLNSTGLQLALLGRRVRRIPHNFQRELLEPIAAVQREVQRLNRLVDDFLDFARPREFAPSPVDLGSLVESVRTLLEPQAGEAGLRIECRCQPVPTVIGEADRLRQAVLNLALNAIQATPAGGVVRLEVGESSGQVFIAIEDTGPGIPAALRPRIFEPFYTTKPNGTGLGLPIVCSIVRRHGGNLSIEDNSPSGTRFVMKFSPSLAS
jgi:anti-sigma regulatory factor (Ser/Thr protein kinase)